MNAVVGLAELAGMKEGVPDNVRVLLSKLRISSHYLLDLINDILDMSRLAAAFFAGREAATAIVRAERLRPASG